MLKAPGAKSLPLRRRSTIGATSAVEAQAQGVSAKAASLPHNLALAEQSGHMSDEGMDLALAPHHHNEPARVPEHTSRPLTSCLAGSGAVCMEAAKSQVQVSMVASPCRKC